MVGSALLVTGDRALEPVQIVRHLRHRDGRVMVLVRDRAGRHAAVSPERLVTAERLLFV